MKVCDQLVVKVIDLLKPTDRASSHTYYRDRHGEDHAERDVISETNEKQDSEHNKSRVPLTPEKIGEISKTGLKEDKLTQAAEGIPLNLSALINHLAIELGKMLQKKYPLDLDILGKKLERETSHDIPAAEEAWKKEDEDVPTAANNSRQNTTKRATLQVRLN